MASSAGFPVPSIVVVVPTLDSYLLLPRLVASLQQQTWPHWRVMFIDGPSQPAHRRWIEDLCALDPRFQWRPQDPTEPGIFGAMNRGFALASHPEDWLLFWGSDDWAASPQVFEKIVNVLQAAWSRGGDTDLLVATARYVKPTDAAAVTPPTLGRRSVFRWSHSFRRSLFLGSTPPHQASLIGPGARQHLARYASGFRLAADLDYFLQLSRWPDLEVECIELELVHMQSGGVSGREPRRRFQEVRLAYGRAFGWLWWLPYGLRYAQRLTSILKQ
jgi:glycosyltransferase involved in cell wall biosynthesis